MKLIFQLPFGMGPILKYILAKFLSEQSKLLSQLDRTLQHPAAQF